MAAPCAKNGWHDILVSAETSFQPQLILLTGARRDPFDGGPGFR